MYIKQPTVIPANIKVTRLPPSDKKVPSNYVLLQAEERRLQRAVEMKDKAEQFTQLLKNGYSAAEALKILKF